MDGMLVYDRREVLQRYVRTSFLFDLELVLLDWTWLFLVSQSTSSLLRGLRLLKLPRLLRAGKLGLITRKFEDTLSVAGLQSLVLAGSVAQILAVILAVTHVLTCGIVLRRS